MYPGLVPVSLKNKYSGKESRWEDTVFRAPSEVMETSFCCWVAGRWSTRCLFQRHRYEVGQSLVSRCLFCVVARLLQGHEMGSQEGETMHSQFSTRSAGIWAEARMNLTLDTWRSMRLTLRAVWPPRLWSNIVTRAILRL